MTPMADIELQRVRALDTLPRVADLAAATTDAITVFAEAQAVPIRPPVLLDHLDALPEMTAEITTRPHSQHDAMYLAKLHGVTVTDGRDMVTPDGRYYTDLWNQAGLHAEPPPSRPNWAEAPAQIDEPCGFLFHNTSSGDNHSHWLVQTLPQLGYYERAGLRPAKLVVQPNIRPYQRDVLAGLGYGEERLLIRAPHEPMRFRELYVGYVDGGLVPDATIFDRQIAAFDTGEVGPEKLYISRQDARGIRRMLNEVELIERLRAEGFTIVTPSALSAAEEVTLFRHARLIVGPLGAGLRIPMMPPGYSNPHPRIVPI
jgi:hypothetical protein